MDISLLKSYDYFGALQYRYKMIRKYPFLSAFTIGKSVMGREISAFTLGNAEEYSLFVGGIHGNAQFTTAILMAFLDELCCKLQEDGVMEGLKVRKAFTGRGLIVVPCLNPDGCEIASHGKSAMGSNESYLQRLVKNNCEEYSLNARGADIELSFFSSPLKEPESAALYSLCESNSIRHAIFFDKGEGEILVPENSPPRSCRMAEIMVSTTGYGLQLSGEDSKASILDNWFCKKYSKPAFKLLSFAEESDYSGLYSSLREFLIISAIS